MSGGDAQRSGNCKAHRRRGQHKCEVSTGNPGSEHAYLPSSGDPIESSGDNNPRFEPRVKVSRRDRIDMRTGVSPDTGAAEVAGGQQGRRRGSLRVCVV